MSIQAIYVDRGPTVCFTALKQSLKSKFSNFRKFSTPYKFSLDRRYHTIHIARQGKFLAPTER